MTVVRRLMATAIAANAAASVSARIGPIGVWYILREESMNINSDLSDVGANALNPSRA